MPSITYSAEFVELRRMQSILNAFLWSSDISYRLLIDAAASGDARFANPGQKTSEALAGIKARAWYPTVDGEPHYKQTISGLLKDVALNETHVYRGMIVQWHAAFEFFLDRRMRPHLGKVRNWGPLTNALCCPQLLHTNAPVQLTTVLRADLVRHLRNQCAHGRQPLPREVTDARVKEWQTYVSNDLKKRFWPDADMDKAVVDAVEYSIGGVHKRTQKVPPAERDQEAAYFYALFSFTNLNKLAVEIELALG
jgi:hypothetical protein